jgi:hypothetical protein
LIVKHVPHVIPEKREPVRAPKPSKPKKNKPMSKTEQENKIEKLRKLKEQFDRQGSTSDDAPAGPIHPCKSIYSTIEGSILTSLQLSNKINPLETKNHQIPKRTERLRLTFSLLVPP